MEKSDIAITDEICQAFYEGQREMALKCIRDPVYIPVVGQATLTLTHNSGPQWLDVLILCNYPDPNSLREATEKEEHPQQVVSPDLHRKLLLAPGRCHCGASRICSMRRGKEP